MTRFNLYAIMLLALALLLSAPRATQAAQSYDNCTGTITSLPAVISTQGTWCLKADVATAITSGNAITVNTNNVTIDCNDFKIGGLAAGLGTTARGIVSTNHLNTTVRRCNIRGFFYGLYFSGASGGGHAVEDNRFDNNTYIGIDVEGDGSVIRRNRVFDTGASTQNNSAYGVVSVYSVDVLDNTISGVTATTGFNGSAFGIVTSSNADGRIIGNGVHGLLKDGSGASEAIDNTSSGRLSLRENDMVGAGSGTGLACSSANGSARDNVISGFITAISTCTDSGGNSILP
jgi:hypothetical protein